MTNTSPTSTSMNVPTIALERPPAMPCVGVKKISGLSAGTPRAITKAKIANSTPITATRQAIESVHHARDAQVFGAMPVSTLVAITYAPRRDRRRA